MLKGKAFNTRLLHAAADRDPHPITMSHAFLKAIN